MGIENISVLNDKQPVLPNCENCGHPANWHRLDDSTNVSPTDPNAKFRCIGYDPEHDRPGICVSHCPDYVHPSEKPKNVRNVFDDEQPM